MNRKLINHLKTWGGAILIGINCGCASEDSSNSNTSIKVKPNYNVEFTQQDIEVCNGINNFSYRLISEVLANDDAVGLDGKNFAISPISCAVEIAMLAESADNGSAQKLCKILEVSDIESLGTACNKLMTYLPAPENLTKFEMANSVWYADRNDAYISDAYVKKMNSTYFADINSADLATKSGMNVINSWIDTKTDGNIRDLSGLLEPSSNIDALIFSALYFNSGEKFTFHINRTANGIFHAPNGDHIVTMMHNYSYGRFYEDDKRIVVIIGHRWVPSNLTIIMPKEGFSLADTCPESEEWYSIWGSTMEISNMELSIPRLSVASDIRLNSLPMFNTLGSITLSGMSIPSGKVGSIGQSTHFILNEDGIDLTSVSRCTFAHPQQDSLPSWIPVTIDRPFLFYVHNVATGAIIMAGRILDASNQNYKL